MNIDNQRKPFPYLRKGEGLSRYSSLTYPSYRKKVSTNICEKFGQMNEAEGDLLPDDAAGRSNGHAELPKPVDSGKGSSPPQELLDVENERQRDVQSSPKEDADALEPSLIDRRLAWEAREQREKVEANHFEALERFLAAMNSTLKSDSPALYKTGALTNYTPMREQQREPTERICATPAEQNNFQTATDSMPPAFLFSPDPPVQVRNGAYQHLLPPTAFPERVPWGLPFGRLPPTLLPPSMQAPLHAAAGVPQGRTDPAAHQSAMMDVEKELRALMTNLEGDVEELQRRRNLFDEHVETTRKQLCAEWQNIEQGKEFLKVQRMKMEQDKNDLLTHRMKMEEEVKAKLEKAEKAQNELKMLQTECQLLKKKLMEQKKQSSDEISSVQQQVIDLQRQAVEADSRSSSLRAQITKLKEECRHHKEEADSNKARMALLETSNERLRVENAQLRSQYVEHRDKAPVSNSAAAQRNSKTYAAGGQPKATQAQTPKCVRFADEPTSFRRTRDFCVQVAGPSDIATQTSFVDTASSAGQDWVPLEGNAVFERSLGNGKREIIYPNDTVRILDNGGTETVDYPNGDVIRSLPDGSKVYRSASDGRTEIRNADGSVVVKNADGSSEKRTFTQDGTEVITYSNGTMVEKRTYGIEVAYLYDKSKETRCCHYTLREFPSGDIKKLFADGSTETRLVCGRVRVKDAQGYVVKDTDEYSCRAPT